MIRYVHTNLIVENVNIILAFYQNVLDCHSIGQTRDLSGSWIDRLTGIPGAHLFGEHLLLPGYEAGGPTLEIFGYDNVISHKAGALNERGFAHIAFAVDDVREKLEEVLAHGGGQIGELVETRYSDGRTLTVVYATDPEGNIIELQSWR
ncbi:MAG: VOC family protein [Eubacteriales bacterium]|jgi:predicted enzyme related to lactoylglutathione lyase|nr:VOC family protein [Eubacteriales bacterium]